MLKQHLKIPAVRFEIGIKDIADDWNSSGNRIDAHVDEHIEKLVLGQAETAGLVDDEKADGGGAEIANPGY